MKNIVILISNNSFSQLKVESDGGVRLWTNNTGSYGNTFVTYTNNESAKCYVVRNGTSDDFYAYGSGYIVARGTYINSDIRLKENVSDISDINNLYKLKPKSYSFKAKHSGKSNDSASVIDSLNSNSQSLLNKEFGFIAQDVQKIFPDLVTEDENGMMSINYTAFIPLITQAITEQKSQIETLQRVIYLQEQELIKLKSDIDNCCENDNKLKLKSSSIDDESVLIDDALHENAKLFDNVPNPFSSNTEIKFEIPENSTSTVLIIHDMQGVELKSFNITQKGFGSIMLHGSELKAGMYLLHY